MVSRVGAFFVILQKRKKKPKQNSWFAPFLHEPVSEVKKMSSMVIAMTPL